MTEVEAVKPERTIHVLTNENADAFYDQQLGITPKEDAAEVKTDEPKAEDVDEEIKKAGKKNPKIESRFSELAAQRRAAEEEAKTAKEEAARVKAERETLQAERDALKAKYEPPKTDPLGPKPVVDQFANTEEYSKALEDWTTEKVERDRATKEAEEREQKEQEKRAGEWKSRQDEARKEITDYDAKINASDVKVSDPIRDAIIESDVGPQLLYHLATNPDVAEKLAGLNEKAALRALYKLEVKLGDKPAEAKTALSDVKAEISKAPAPITPLKGGGVGADTPLIDGNNQFHGSYAQWKEARRSGKIK